MEADLQGSLGASMDEPNVIVEHDTCDCETLSRYTKGGYHPVVVNDIIGGRYRVLHKLGYGGTATVWLVRDQERQLNVALKIFTAEASRESGKRELSAYQHLQATLPPDQRGLIAPLYDSFDSVSPNGSHLCLALGLSGPSLSSMIRTDKPMKFRADAARQLSYQVAQGLAQIHQAGIIYHDLTPNNILLQLDDEVTRLSVVDLYARLGKPKSYPLEPIPGSSEPDAEPTHVYDSLDFTTLENITLVTPSIKFVDLAEVGYVDQEDPYNVHGVTLLYTDPETLWWRVQQTQAADIWSLACIIFELRASDTLIAPGDGSVGKVKLGIRKCLGGTPEAWLRKEDEEDRANGIEYVDPADMPQTFDFSDFDFSGIDRQIKALEEAERPRGFFQRTKAAVTSLTQAIMSLFPARPTPTHYWIEEGLKRKAKSLEDTIRDIGTWTPWCHMTIEQRMQALREMHKYLNTRNVKITRAGCDTGEPPHVAMDEEEIQDFLELLSPMLTWYREDRVTIEQVLESRWFSKEYPGDQDEPWIQKYHRGYQYWSDGEPIF